MKKIAVINACTDLGVNINGTCLGPEIISKNITENKYTIKPNNTEKENQKDNNKKNLDQINEFNNRLYNKVKELVENGYIPMTIGGDHSIAIGSSLATISKYEKMGVIWFDAHGDFNSFETTTTGNIHGIPLAAITNYEKKYLTDFHNRKLF